VFHKLATKADVIENLRPGVMEGWDVGYRQIKEINPGIIYIAKNGFGQWGKYAKENRPSNDELVAMSIEYSQKGRLAPITTVGATSYVYDANGNMVSRGGQTITWDVENRPVSIENSTFVYDGDGNRVMKTENGETILYINRYYEKNLTTSEVTTSYYLGGRLIAQRVGVTLNYVHQDHLTGTSVVSDSGGSLVSSIKYFPFGSTRSGSVPTDKQFTGQRLDGTGLYYYGARYYDAEIGRFISADTIVPDPANPQAFNRYSYCLNNPLIYNDPTGHDPTGDDDHYVKVFKTAEGFYLFYKNYNGLCVGRYAESWEQIASLYSNVDIFYWDSDASAIIYAYYDSDVGWYGAEWAYYDPDSPYGDVWVYNSIWTEHYANPYTFRDWSSWGKLRYITDPENFVDPRDFAWSLDALGRSVADVLYGIAAALEFLAPGISMIPPEYILAAIGLACIFGPEAVVGVAGVYAAATYVPAGLEWIADNIEPP
jgi:RHS repeat-associated protein